MLRALWMYLVGAVATLVLGVTAIAYSLVRPGSDFTLKAAKLWSRLILGAAGLKPVYEGFEHVEASQPCIILSNHRSTMDIWALMPALPDRARFVAKHTLRRVPVIGQAMALSGFIFIDRGNLGRAIGSLRRAAGMIRAGRTVVLFPEGTRSPSGRLLPFKKGAFHLALEAGVPVIPCAILGTWEAMPPRRLLIRRGEVRVRFGKPIDPAAYRPNQYQALMADVRAAIVELLPPGASVEPEAGGAIGAEAR